MATIRYLFTIMSLFSFLLGGCSKKSASQSPVAPPVLKVAVFGNGRLTVDGATSTIQSLRESLRSLSEQHGVVWYYREASQQDAPSIAMEAMKEIADAGLPIRLSSLPDYSDSVGGQWAPVTK